MTDPIALLTATATAYNTAKGILSMLQSAQDLKNSAEKNAALIDIQKEATQLLTWLTDAKFAEHEAKQKIIHLEEQLLQKENWEHTKAQYKLTELAPFTYVYAIKEPQDTNEPQHYLCTNCFQGMQKSILTRTNASNNTLHCATCGSDVELPENYSQIFLNLTSEQMEILKFAAQHKEFPTSEAAIRLGWGETTATLHAEALFSMGLIKKRSVWHSMRGLSKQRLTYRISNSGRELLHARGLLSPDM